MPLCIVSDRKLMHVKERATVLGGNREYFGMGRSTAPLGVTSMCHYLEADIVLPEVDVGGSIPPGLPFVSYQQVRGKCPRNERPGDCWYSCI